MFAKTMLTGGSRRWFRLPAIPLAIKGALKKSQTACALNSTYGNDAQQRFGNVSRLSTAPALRAQKDSRSPSGPGQRGLTARRVQGKKTELEFCETIANIFRWPWREAQALGHQLQIVPKLVVIVLYLISDLAPLRHRECWGGKLLPGYPLDFFQLIYLATHAIRLGHANRPFQIKPSSIVMVILSKTLASTSIV